MGWKAKTLTALAGLAAFGAGAWFLGVICFAYLVISMRPKRRGPPDGGVRSGFRVSPRHVVGGFMVLLSALAVASGGTLSPPLFLAAGGVVLFWPTLVRRMPLGGLVPVNGSILMRSKYVPTTWCAVAELKPGAGPFPMAASSFAGTLLVCTDTGRTYSLVRCSALGRGEAEAKVIERFRSAAPTARAGAYLLPLNSDEGAGVLRQLGRQTKLPPADLPGAASRVSAFLVLDCTGGSVTKYAAYETGGTPRARLPGGLHTLEGALLSWEVFDGVGKRTRFPEPDGLSNLLDSMLATKGIPLAERVSELQSSADVIRVRSLSGDEVSATRTQLRAVVSIYS